MHKTVECTRFKKYNTCVFNVNGIPIFVIKNNMKLIDQNIIIFCTRICVCVYVCVFNAHYICKFYDKNRVYLLDKKGPIFPQ